MNAINRALIDELDVALSTAAEEPSIRVIVLTGSGKAFCAGGDLKELLGSNGSLDPSALLKFVRYAADTIERIPAMKKPVIAAVNGLALAGGLEVALACDLVIASDSARLGDAHANFGVLPGGGGTVRLGRAVGPTVARYLAYTGDALPAAEFVPLGLVNRVVPDDEFVGCVTDLATRIASKSPLVLAHMKRLIREGLDRPLMEALQLEHDALAVHVNSADMLEGLAAFREKRKPSYTGN